MIRSISTYEFPNGIRLIHRLNDSEVGHFGLLTHTGTRDENPDEQGLAHFMEHMFFKGTPKRSPYQIISRLEDVGGEINAYTTKEETAIYASFLKNDYRRAMELIQDIFLNSTFPEKERDIEAGVILNEIQAYDESPSDLIFDRAEEVLYPHHSIGRNILGTQESLSRFNRGILSNFRKENYATDEMVLSFVGSIPFARVKAAAEKYFGAIPGTNRIRPRIRPEAATSSRTVEKKDISQKHSILIGEAYALPDERRLQLYLLNNILGGPGMNSRLNLALRERRGYSYSAESHYAPYTDTGALMIYFSCDPEKFKGCMQVCREELSRLRSKLIQDHRLEKAKRQMLGQLAISRENNEHLMLTQAKSFLVFGSVDSMDDIRRKLDEIGAPHLRDVANEILDLKKMNQVIVES